MSDKFRKTFPIAVTFADGEQPPAAKLNALGSQARNGLAIVEKGVGDIWNQSGDSILIPTGDLFKNALYVNNIGRALGQQSMIAPRIPSLPSLDKYVDVIVTPGAFPKPEAWLRYRPVPAGPSLVSGDFVINSSTPGGALTTYVTSPDLVDAAGKWHVTSNGKLIVFTPIDDVSITYKPFPVPDIDDVATATVIPDPFTDLGLGTEFNGLKISYANDTNNSDGYWVYLPPRRPLIAARKIAQSPDHTGNQEDPTSLDRYFFQDPTMDAATGPNAVHYRYKFPKEIQDVIDLAAPSALPDNFMYLMDTETGTIIEGVAFSVDATAPLYVVKAVGSKLDEITTETPALVTLQADEDASAYKDRLKLMCAGNSLARAQAGLAKLYFNHTHIGADGSLPLSHSQLLDLYNTNSPSWEPSSLRGDDHPQYLHRDGMGTRDNLKNGMRGDILLLASDNTVSLTVDSYKLRFGSDSSPFLGYDLSDNAVNLDGRDLRVVTGIVRYNDLYLVRNSASQLILRSATAINDIELYAGKITASSAAGTTPSGTTISMNADGAGGGGTLSSNSPLHFSAPSAMVDNAVPLYFPSTTTQTDVFLNRTRVDNLVKSLALKKAWESTWVQGDTADMIISGAVTPAYANIGSSTLVVTTTVPSRIVLHFWSNWHTNATNGATWFRVNWSGTGQSAGDTGNLVSHGGDPTEPTSVAGDNEINGASFSRAAFGGNLLAAGTFTFQPQAQPHNQNGNMTLWVHEGSLVAVVYPEV